MNALSRVFEYANEYYSIMKDLDKGVPNAKFQPKRSTKIKNKRKRRNKK